MKINGRELIYRQLFLEEVEAMKEYLGQFGNQPTQKFSEELRYILTHRIPNYPESYPKYKKQSSSKKEYRRALFQKKYYIIYYFDYKSIEYIRLYHSSKNPDSIEID